MPLATLFALITLAFASISVLSARAGQWVIAAASAALAAWMASLARAAIRKMRR